jgi:YD repeat-containing protein
LEHSWASGQNLNTTAAAITSALIGSLNGSGSPVNASLSGSATILLTAKGVGTATDLTVTGSSTASFTASSTTLSNGTNPGGFYAPYVTTYSSDPLGNLLQVNQPGDGSQASRVRSFTYDSLSRLLTAYNPESGTISYTYDANSNVTTKTDARGIVTNYSPTSSPIDPLNRVTAVTYSDGTPSVTFGYDVGCCGVNPQNGVGRLTYTTSGNTELVYVYDPMGRIKAQADCPPSGIARGYCYSISASYDLTGALTSLSYPDGQTTITLTNNTAAE